MEVREYVHIFKVDDGTHSSIPTTAGPSKIKTTKLSSAQESTIESGLRSKLTESTIERAVISPLNSATGGLASPAYSLGKTLLTGGTAAAIGGGIATVAIAGVMLAVNKIEQRVARMESKAEQMNNRDNTLIRAGSKGFATEYTGGLSGVKSNSIGRD